MIAFILSPFGRYLALALAIMSLAWLAVAAIRMDAAQDALNIIERANSEAQNKADRGELNAKKCPPELWSREAQSCSTKVN